MAIQTRAVIGLDVGHSTVKMSVIDHTQQHHSIIFPSVVCPAIDISESNTRRAAERETVELDGRRFFFGHTAVTQGVADSETGLSEAWITTAPYSALILGAVKKLAELPTAIDLNHAIFVVGLPAKFYSAQRPLLQEVMRRLIPGTITKVLPQPLGPFMNLQFEADGTEAAGHSIKHESWATIEIGHFTTDLGLVRNALWVERNSGSCRGGYVLTERLAAAIKADTGHVFTALEATAAVTDGYYLEYGRKMPIAPYLAEAAQPLVDEILDTTARLLDRDVRGLNGVIVAGGAAKLLFPTLSAKYPHAVLAPTPRFAVAEGFARFGAAYRNDLAYRDQMAA
jgi:plasmid segregation protein ParM